MLAVCLPACRLRLSILSLRTKNNKVMTTTMMVLMTDDEGWSKMRRRTSSVVQCKQWQVIWSRVEYKTRSCALCCSWDRVLLKMMGWESRFLASFSLLPSFLTYITPPPSPLRSLFFSLKKFFFAECRGFVLFHHNKWLWLVTLVAVLRCSVYLDSSFFYKKRARELPRAYGMVCFARLSGSNGIKSMITIIITTTIINDFLDMVPWIKSYTYTHEHYKYTYTLVAYHFTFSNFLAGFWEERATKRGFLFPERKQAIQILTSFS